MKEFVLGTFCLFFGVAVGYFGRSPAEKTVVEEKIVEKVVTVNDAPVIKINAVQGIEDLRPGKDAVNAVLVFDKEVPNGYGLIVLDVNNGKVKVKVTNQQGPGMKWGAPIDRLHAQFSPKQLGVEVNDLIGRSGRFYSSDFPPEVLHK